MSDLRETIDRIIREGYAGDHDGHVELPYVDDVYSQGREVHPIDAILAAFHDAMTSDAVALEVGTEVAFDTLKIVEKRAPFTLGTIPYTENGRRYIAAALAAAGVTKGGDA